MTERTRPGQRTMVKWSLSDLGELATGFGKRFKRRVVRLDSSGRPLSSSTPPEPPENFPPGTFFTTDRKGVPQIVEGGSQLKLPETTTKK